MRVLDTFKNITNYDIAEYFYWFSDFISNQLSSIDAYCKGNSTNKEAFNMLSTLLLEANRIQEILSLNKNQLSSDTSFWDLLDDFEETKNKLETINNWGKWSQSSYVFGYDSKAKDLYTLSQNETIEGVSNDTGSNNPQDDWANLSVSNQLKEIDYSKAGGNTIYVNNISNRGSLKNSGVIDFMSGEKVLGLDMPKKISFDNDDVKSLTHQDTLSQAAEISLTVTKKSVPELPTVGFNKDIVGNGVLFVLMNVFKRDIAASFNLDKSFKVVSIQDMRVEQDSVFYEVNITSILDQQITLTI